jgi:hypothetical protein
VCGSAGVTGVGDPGVPGTVVVVAPGEPGAVVVVAAAVVVVVGAGLDTRVDVVVPARAVVGDTADVVDVAPALVGVVVAPATVVVAAAAQTGVVIVLVSRVTAPLRARSRPAMVAPVVAVIDVMASTLPTRCDPVPSVAEEPICQNTLQAVLLPITTTLLADAVTSVDAALKMNTAFGSPWVLSVIVPVIARVPAS